jgi:hypothetical protein
MNLGVIAADRGKPLSNTHQPKERQSLKKRESHLFI